MTGELDRQRHGDLAHERCIPSLNYNNHCGAEHLQLPHLSFHANCSNLCGIKKAEYTTEWKHKWVDIHGT